MTVNIAATFKRDERENNGLTAIADQLIEEPLTRHVVVGLIETKRVTKDVADDTETPTIKFVMLEPLDGAPAKTAQDLLNAARMARLGRGTDPTLLDSVGPEE